MAWLENKCAKDVYGEDRDTRQFEQIEFLAMHVLPWSYRLRNEPAISMNRVDAHRMTHEKRNDGEDPKLSIIDYSRYWISACEICVD